MKLHYLWYIAVALIIYGLVIIISAFRDDRKVSAETMRLCNEYARRDHRKEMTEERWEYLERLGNPNDTEFFYRSCLNHTKCPVANGTCAVDNVYMGGKK